MQVESAALIDNLPAFVDEAEAAVATTFAVSLEL